MSAPAIPAAAPRPRNGARAKATDPATSAWTPIPTAKAIAAAGEIESSGNVAPTMPVAHVTIATAAMAIPTAATCAATFCSAIERLEWGVATANSRLPRRASPARVEDSARMDQSPAKSAKYGP